MSTLKVRVERIADVAEDIRIFELAPIDGARLPPFAAGAHIDVHLPCGPVRQYSLCGDPADRGYTIAVKREPLSRGGSEAMHAAVRPGDELTIGVPRNRFPLEPGADRYLLLAGGIGITPLFAMARELLAARADFHLHYFARSAEHAAFHGALSAASFSGKVHLHYGLGPDEVDARLSTVIGERPDNALLYVCGPQPFMSLVQEKASAAWPPGAVRSEHFSADAATGSTGHDGAFTVRLARTGLALDVPAGKSIAQVLAENGVHLETSCEQGICGTCVTAVLEGGIDHRDACLTESERDGGGLMCPCVSRAAGALLVLDL